MNLSSRPLFQPGDRVTYVQSVERIPLWHGTIISEGRLARDDEDSSPYRIYTVQNRGSTGNAGIGSPWCEDCLVRGWIGPLQPWAGELPAYANDVVA